MAVLRSIRVMMFWASYERRLQFGTRLGLGFISPFLCIEAVSVLCSPHRRRMKHFAKPLRMAQQLRQTRFNNCSKIDTTAALHTRLDIMSSCSQDSLKAQELCPFPPLPSRTGHLMTFVDIHHHCVTGSTCKKTIRLQTRCSLLPGSWQLLACPSCPVGWDAWSSATSFSFSASCLPCSGLP